MIDFVIAVLTIAATVYGASAGAKLRGRPAYRSFRAGLAETALVPRRRLSVTAAALVGSEAVVAGLAIAAVGTTTLLTGAAVVGEWALVGAALLTSVLAAGVATVMCRGTRARCACFGSSSGRPLGGVHLLRNVSLLVVLLSGLAGSELGHRRPELAGAAVAVAAGAVAGLLLTRFDDLIELFMPISPASTPAARTVTPAPSAVRPQSPAARSASHDGTTG
ncbi:MAG TPA: MauE/DoxX family redox-associated membrane protein [Streptosporangiaceae bacterium]